MDNEEIWSKPPVSEITETLETELEKRPEEVSVNVILTGKGAARFYFAKSLLENAYPNLSESDIIKFLVRAGAEREIERLAYIWNLVKDENSEL
jgi:hypothetical protein